MFSSNPIVMRQTLERHLHLSPKRQILRSREIQQPSSATLLRPKPIQMPSHQMQSKPQLEDLEREIYTFETSKEDKQQAVDNEEYLRVWYDNLAMRSKLRLL